MKTNNLQGHLTRTSLFLALLAPLTAAALSVSGSNIPATSQEPLSEDTDAGAIVDREGVAGRKAVMASRWGPADARTRIELGDWLKTGSRGANALAIELAGGGDVLLGPATLVEVVDGKRLRLSRGELRVTATEDAPVEVAGPGDTTIRVTRRTVLRARDGQLVRLSEDPRWLTGYETNSSTEALGSLLANVDGRDLPLTIGYHKVTVDIRDQIARTVIEESFVNHTHTILEGIFYFPLPPGASISSFGMWINGELVQGDIVEKQRAREIYETILSERRDPGLLEWTGGNIFKARVFPIGAEKRIRLSYTQVLPKEGDTYVYNYALQSEMLRKTPLRRLQIEVNVASAETLTSVQSPSHECRVRTTGNSAKVEFDAEEYSPDKDFELRIRTQSEGWKVTAVPHRRGDDGYFMLLIDTPELATERSVPAFEPLDVLVIADTSGSMWGPARPTQVDFVEALLGALSEHDTLNLMTADAAARFAFDRPRAADDSAREEALAFLEARRPLGWSDLDRAFAAAFEVAGPNTHVIYVGDGQPTTGDADPIALAHRLQREWKGNGTFHAVVPGTRSEPAVLRALAGLGGGSVRSIGGGSDPAATAFALLREIAAPAVKDITLDFEGMSVAAVYPEVLPNLPLGGQQVVVGRFDPTLGDTTGRITVNGVVNGQAVSFETNVVLDVQDGDADSEVSADRGNSFVPRLWARNHLDHLLDQGSSKKTRESIIAVSEDFQIITPYTSFLVLESDADRERFDVQRQFRMRDGEEFFAEGRESGRHELLKQQMLAAKTWRKRLRAEMLATLALMNRELTEFLRNGGPVQSGQAGALGFSSSLAFNGYGYADSRFKKSDMDGFGQSPYTRSGPVDAMAEYSLREGEDDKERFADEQGDWAGEPAMEMEERVMRDMSARSPAPSVARSRMAAKSMKLGFAGGRRNELAQGTIFGGKYRNDWGRYNRPYFYDPFAQLFPTVGPVRAAAPELSWPEEVVTLLSSLDRRTSISASDRGWALGIETEYHDLRGRVQTTSGTHFLSRDRWSVRGAHLPGSAYSLQYVEGGRRGLISVGWNLGRVRDAEEGDASAWPAPFAWHFGDSLRGYAAYEARLEEGEGGLVLVYLHTAQAPTTELVLVIDRERAVVTEQRWTVDGEITRGLAFSDFKAVGGVWWPGQIRTWSKDRKDYSLTRIRALQLDAATFTEQLALDLELRSDSILMEDDATDLAAAKQAAKDGDATLEQHWMLLRHFGGTQRWELAAPHLAAVETLQVDKPGLVPIRSTYMQQSRRNEELRQLLMEVAQDLSNEPRDAEHGMATQLLNHTGGLNQGNELYAVLEALEPLFARQTGMLDGRMVWDQRMQQAAQNVGRPEEAFARLEAMTALYPYLVHIQTQYANALARLGEVDRAMAFLGRVEEENGPWQPYEVGQLRQTGAQLLWNGYRLNDFVTLVEDWERQDPTLLNSGILNQYLSALVFLDRETEAWERIETWLTEYRKPELDAVETMRLQAAIQLALGNGRNLSTNRFEDDRSEMLAETARYLTGLDDGQQYLAAQILQHYYFRQTDVARALLGELYTRLETEVAELSATRISLLVSWLRGAAFETDAGQDGWQSILDGIFERWLVAQTDADRQALGQLVLSYGRRELVLRHHRHVLQTAQGETAIAAAAHRLYQALLAGPWDAEIQAELLGLLPRVAMTAAEGGGELDATAQAASLRTQIVALYDLVSWLPPARAQAEVAALPEVNSMPRRLLAARRDAALRTAQTATIELLEGLSSTLQREELRDWASVERAYLLVKTRANVRQARETSMRILNALSAKHIGAEVADDVPLRDRILAARCAATVAHLLAHYDAETRDKHEPAYLSLLDTGIEQGTLLLEWRELKYALLVALDRGDAVETALAEWYAGGEEFAKVRWGRDYAYVLAERSQLERATQVLQEIEGIDELGHDDYRALADWYTALDRADSAREMRIRSWEVQGENAIGQALSREAGIYQRNGDNVPPELDPEIPLRFVALLRKATYPANWVWTLQSYFSATKDFRLLECLPEAVIGQSSQKIYPFLSNMAGIASEIHEEATVDRLREHLAEMARTRAKTDVDRRALALLEFAVVRQATMQGNGTEDHAAIALAALKRAFRGQWEAGEPPMMAEFLASQGRLQPESLAREQLNQMRKLLRVAEHAQDRFVIQGRLADLYWSYGRQDDAIRTLTSALEAHRSTHDGLLPNSANDRLSTLTTWMQAVGSYRAAEKVWLREMGADRLQDQRLWLEQRLFELYRDALLARAEVSLGSGLELYVAVHDRMLAALEVQTNEGHAYQLVNTLCDLWKRAHKHLKYSRIPRDVVRFAYGALPQVLDRYQYRNGQGMVGTTADTLAEVRDARTTLDFLAGRAENEPRWLRLRNQDFWSQHAWRLGHMRRLVGRLDASLTERVLAIVTRELKEDLRTRQARNRSIYDVHNSDFWSEQREAFLATALASLEEHSDSGPSITYATDYLFHGLNAHELAIDGLFRAYAKDLLDIGGRAQLAVFLQQMRRWAESLPVIAALVEEVPGEVHYRVMLMRGHHGTDNPEEVARSLDAAIAWYREHDAWTEAPIAALAEACLKTRLLEQALGLFDEAIALHVKSSPNRGVGDGILAPYYRKLAATHAALGNTDKAVDAAAGAIVSWGHTTYQRNQELVQLEQVLFDSRDLDAYVARFDRECADSGLENPIVRKALGKVYARKKAFPKAAAQLRLALLAQPNDMETHQHLVAACTNMQRPDLAAEALLEWARAEGHGLSQYRQLGDLWTRLERTDDAERAYTNLVELSPNESEYHTSLAEVRQNQNRWEDALPHWRHVIRIRTNEPAGYFGLSRALIRLRHWDEAREVVDEIMGKDWPERFGNVHEMGRGLIRDIPRSR